MNLSEVSQYVDQKIEIKGWLVNKRSSGKIHFLQLRDGTGFIQGTIFKGDVTEELFDQLYDHLINKSSLLRTICRFSGVVLNFMVLTWLESVLLSIMMSSPVDIWE